MDTRDLDRARKVITEALNNSIKHGLQDMIKYQGQAREIAEITSNFISISLVYELTDHAMEVIEFEGKLLDQSNSEGKMQKSDDSYLSYTSSEGEIVTEPMTLVELSEDYVDFPQEYQGEEKKEEEKEDSSPQQTTHT